MARRKDLTDMADDYFDDDDYDQEDEDLEYLIEDIQNFMNKTYKREFLINLIEKYDYDQDAIVDHLFQHEEKLKEKQQKQKNEKQSFPTINKQKPHKKSKAENRVQDELENIVFVRKSSVKLSKDEIKVLPYNREQWNLPYPQILPKNEKTEFKDLLPNTINVGIFGHVDTGKSTLLGHLFYKLKIVDEKEMRKNTKESLSKGKQSFKYAWILDQMDEERERGVTIDTNERTILYGKKKIHFIDTPGHVDFIFNTMKGASQAEVALILIDAQNFDADMQKQVYQKHMFLVQSKEIKYILICVNKMDKINWNEDRFIYIQKKLLEFFKKENLFKDVKLQFTPISAYTGENLAIKTDLKWYKGQCLLKQLEDIEHVSVNQEIQKPLRMIVKNMFKGINNKHGFGFNVKIEQGILENKDKILIMPTNEITHIQHIYNDTSKLEYAICGDTVDIICQFQKEEDFDTVKKGYVLCDPLYPIPYVKKFKAILYTLTLKHPIIPGTKFNFHIGLQNQLGNCKKLLKLLNVQNDSENQKNPRLIQSKQKALIMVELDDRICLENQMNSFYFGKVTLSDEFNTVAYGKIVELIE